MSNLIKYPFVQLNGKEAYVINREEREDAFIPLHKQAVSAEQKEDVPTEVKARGRESVSREEERLRYQEEAESILAAAREQADIIVTQAQEQAKQLYQEAYENGKVDGFSAGEVGAKEHYRELEEKLQEERERQMLKHQRILEEIEPKYVDVMVSLIQKVTGVLLEERKDILLYLLKNCIYNLDKSSRYIIRVSKEDVFEMEAKKQEIKECLREDAVIEVVEEKTLLKNQCIVETDSQMVDCGIQTQLENLIESLKMLVS